MKFARVLWADDQPEFVSAVRRVIEPIAAEVRTCINGDQVLEALAEWKPELVLLDLKMPPGVWGGLAVLERLGARARETPMIAISGAGSVSQCIRALDLGAVHYIEKEDIREGLLQGIETAIKKFEERRAADDNARVKAIEISIHAFVLSALAREARDNQHEDVFIFYVPQKIAIKTYERRLANGGGRQEEFLDLMDLRAIVDDNPTFPEFWCLDKAVPCGRRADRTKWMVELGHIRNLLAHPVRREISEKERHRLAEIEGIVRRWTTAPR